MAAIFEDVLQENYLLDLQVKGKVTLQTTRPVDREGVLVILDTLLKMNCTALGRQTRGVPVLLKMRVVGGLFGQCTDSTRRADLLVLLTPRAIRSQTEAREVTEEFRRKLKELKPERPSVRENPN